MRTGRARFGGRPFFQIPQVLTAPATSCGSTSVEPQARKRADHKRPIGELVLERGMILHARSLRADHFAVAVDALARLSPIERSTSLGEHLDTVSIIDAVFSVNCFPQCETVPAKSARRRRA